MWTSCHRGNTIPLDHLAFVPAGPALDLSGYTAPTQSFGTSLASLWKWNAARAARFIIELDMFQKESKAR